MTGGISDKHTHVQRAKFTVARALLGMRRA
jgi:hypothetical protein